MGTASSKAPSPSTASTSLVTKYFVEIEYVVEASDDARCKAEKVTKVRKAVVAARDEALTRLAQRHGGRWTASDFGPRPMATSSKEKGAGRHRFLVRGNEFEFSFPSPKQRSAAAASLAAFVGVLPAWSRVMMVGASDESGDHMYTSSSTGRGEGRSREKMKLFTKLPPSQRNLDVLVCLAKAIERDERTRSQSPQVDTAFFSIRLSRFDVRARVVERVL